MNLKSMTLPELTAALKELGQPAFRGKQVYTWLHKGVRGYEEMTNLPKGLRDTLSEKYPIHAPEVVRRQESQKDGTIKYLWKLADGNCVETVLMRYHYGNTVCISTEVGCRMGCAFCASTIGGLVRRLEPYEMLDEVLFTQVDSGLPISHIVLMGIGEPLDNFDNVMRFLELVNSAEGMNISMRHISLSTCGLVPKIDELAKRKLQISLAISLHGPNDEIRDRIMPVNKAYPIDELLEACRRYYAATSRRIHFEYAMIDGVNDRECDARELLRRLKGLGAHINMIPLNHVEESPYKPSSKAAVARFQKILEEGGITATVRRTLGGDIDASCGQLRRKYSKERQQS
ncbi:MAG: 23S rRNA (adenine(2503)-C(2))-methyltransferase RlmN [Oscillospiraceae bacterium]|nr:23S rRNA (adenine(2503)-C(2))-methyltransferase RlmN [Oscillospiraceae bacterium]